ncbi:MAG: bifunctional histidinol-phosphatase/imidazoleglycerol-phosphate dehydratase HisB [Buchnera aphidicola (Kaburagia rhusicola ensigallis)]
MHKNVLFIDRDGTLITEPIQNRQVDNINKLTFEKYVISTLVELKNFGYTFVMITNQDGLGSKKFPFSDFLTPHQFMINIFLSQGIVFEDILICPHEEKYNCYCRKPKLGMLEKWLCNGKLNKKNSYVIGDRDSDMQLAQNMGLSGLHYGKNGCTWNTIKIKLTKKNRYAYIKRHTKETNIEIELWLDKEGNNVIDTRLHFFNHMLDQIAIHSKIKMKIIADGDINIDDHHTVEDVGIALGEALDKALGSKVGLDRFGFVLPMDESVGHCLLDISGRPFLKFESSFKFQYLGDMSTEMVQHFFRSLAFSMKVTLHLKSIGENDHHSIESLFKAFGRTLRQAINASGTILPSSKGIL